jgi:cation diffusion facilitator family transporter
VNATHSAAKNAAARSSFFVSVALTLIKTLAAVMSGSLALYSDALHGVLDIAATATTWWAVHAAAAPPDDNHPYGHEKVESLAALGETAFLFVLAGGVVWEATQRFLHHTPPDITVTPLVIALLLITLVVDGWRWWSLRRTARETHSPALAADALHFSSDWLGTFAALVALGFVSFGYHQADTIAAIVVAVIIAVAGWHLMRRTVDALLDAAPAGLNRTITDAVAQVKGVVAVTSVRVRPQGGKLIGDVAVDVARTQPIAHLPILKEQIRARLEEELHDDWSDVDVLIALTPRALSSESIADRVRLTAAQQHVFVHHLTVAEGAPLDGSVEAHLFLDMDVEIDGNASLDEAHARLTDLENALRENFGQNTHCETHLEPLRADPVNSVAADFTIQAQVSNALADTMQALTPSLSDLSNVRVRVTPFGWIVHYRCKAAPDATVVSVHRALDVLERAVREKLPSITRLVGHPEPR